MTLGREAGGFLTMDAGDVVVAIVQRSGEMRSRSTSLSAPDRSIIYEDYGSTRPGKKVSGGHSSYSSTDDANVRPNILGQ